MLSSPPLIEMVGKQDCRLSSNAVTLTCQVGSFRYRHAVGKHDHPNDQPVQEDAMFLLASMTKLLTSIAALQLVEAGLIKLDDDVSKILPEVGEQKILKGFDGDSPILEDRKNPLTLRHVSDPPSSEPLC